MKKPTSEQIIGSLGALPYMLSEQDPRPAREQLSEHYQHGGGWRPFNSFRLGKNDELISKIHDLEGPDDPPLHPVARVRLRDEWIMFYRFSWVAIIQPDGSFEVCRMD